MSTVSKIIANIIVRGDGYYPGDSLRVVKIVKYDDAWGGSGYGITYETQTQGLYAESKWVRNPRIYWEASEKTPT